MEIPQGGLPKSHNSRIEAASKPASGSPSFESGANPELRLSVIVPTCNRKELLITRTLPAMFRQNLPSDQFEIIVVVDGSTDGTAQAVRELKPSCSLQLIEQSNSGPSVARNSGIRIAQGKVVLFIDDDIICAPNLFRLHLEAHSDVVPTVAYGQISIAPDTPASVMKFATESWYEDYYRRIESQDGLILPQDNYLISNSSMPRNTLVDCCGFDETITAREDYELAIRLWKRGLRFNYLPHAQAYEFFQKSAQHVVHNDGRSFGQTDVLLARKHPEIRPYTSFAAMGKTAGWKRIARRSIAALPFSPTSALNPLLSICDKLSRFSQMQKTGQYLLGIGRNMAEFRAAARMAGSWQALDSEFGQRLPVLLYHHVGPEYPGGVPGLTISPKRFERHVRWLADQGYKGICPSDWLRWCKEGKGLPSKPVLLTFDDGYADLVEYAFPILTKYGFGASTYIVTGQLGGINSWDVVRGNAPIPLMTAEQILHWAKHGIEFGAHTRTHADLTKLTPNEVKCEVEGSAEDLEKLLGARVVSFAYPYGFKTPQVVDCVRDSFEIAFGIDPREPGINYLLTDRHLLQRSMVNPTYSVFDLASCVRRGYSLLDVIRMKTRLRSRLKRAARVVLGRA